MDPSQVFVPMLAYESGSAAMDWLIQVFGFVEKAHMVDAEGRLSHGELELNGQVIMLATPVADYQSPRRVREHYPPAAQWSKVPYIINGVLVYVDDIEEVLKRARLAKAIILSEIETGPPGRRFRMEDLEGQRWFVFARGE